MTAIAKREPVGMPMPMAPMVAEMVRSFQNRLDWPEGRLDRATISGAVAPTDDERRMLAARRDDVGRSLTRASRPEIGRLVAWVRSLMPAQGGDDPELTVNGYISTLSAFPLWALDQVCRDFVGGKVPGHQRFAPTPDQIASRARNLVAPFEGEIAVIGKILRAEVIPVLDEEARERIAKGLRDLANRIGESSRKEQDEREAAARKRLAEANAKARQRELEAHGISDGLPISISLRRQLGMPVPELPTQGLSDD